MARLCSRHPFYNHLLCLAYKITAHITTIPAVTNPTIFQSSMECNRKTFAAITSPRKAARKKNTINRQ